MLAGIQGGDFVQGFAAGALSSIASSFWNGGTTTTTANGVTSKKVHQGISGFLGITDPTAGALIFGAVAGGAGAALTKGNVWQGAATGFIVAGLNHLAHMAVGVNIDPKPKRKSMVQKLHRMFDAVEEFGAWT